MTGLAKGNKRSRLLWLVALTFILFLFLSPAPEVYAQGTDEVVTNSDAGIGTDTDIGMDTGSAADTDTGADTDTAAGTDTDTDAGTATGTGEDTDTDIDNEPSTGEDNGEDLPNQEFIDQDLLEDLYQASSSVIMDAIDAALQNNNGNPVTTIYIDGGTYFGDLILDGELTQALNGLEIVASGNGGVPTIQGNVLLSNLVNFLLEGFSILGLVTIQDSRDIAIVGTESDDTLQIVLQGRVENISVEGGAGNDTVNLSGSSENDDGSGESGVTVAGGSGDDWLIVDFSRGNPLPAKGLHYDGGDDYDVISFQGGSFQRVEYQAVNSHSGRIKFDGLPVSYEHIEPIYHNGAVNDLIINSTGEIYEGLVDWSSDDEITIDYVGDVVEGGTIRIAEAIRIASASFETIYFSNAKNVTINALGGNDIINLGLSRGAAGLMSLTIQGGDGDDLIRNNGASILLPGVDLRLEAEQINLTGGKIEGQNISLLAETTYQGGLNLNPYTNIENNIELSGTTIEAAGNLLVRALSKQLKPWLDNGLLAIKKTAAGITVVNSVLTTGGTLNLEALAELELELNGFLMSLPLDITVATAYTAAKVIVKGNSALTAAGDVLLSAIANVKVASLAKAQGTGAVTFAVSIVDSEAEALLQGSSRVDTEGILTILAQNDLQVTTAADGFVDNGAAGGAGTVAVSVVDTDTRAGIYEFASIINSNQINITANSKNEIQTAAQSAINGPSDKVEDILATEVNGTPLLPQEVQDGIMALLGKLVEGIKKGNDGSGGSGGSSGSGASGGSGEEEPSGVQAAGALAFGSNANNTEAAILSKELIKTVGLLELTAKALTNASILASGMTSGGTVGAGAAVALLYGNNSNQALIGEGAEIEAHDLKLSALSEDYAWATGGEEPCDQTNNFTVEAFSGQSADDVGLGGAIAFNLVINHTKASVGKNAQVALSGGDLTIHSRNYTTVTTKADGAPAQEEESKVESYFSKFNLGGGDGDGQGSSGGDDGGSGGDDGPKVGLGASIALTIVDILSDALVDDGALITGARDMVLESDADSTAETDSAAGAAGGTAAVPVAAMTILISQGMAGFRTGTRLDLARDLRVETKNLAKSSAKASGQAAGSDVGLGAALAINILVEKTTATTGRDIWAGGNVAFRAQGAARGSSTAEAGTNGGEKEEESEGDGDEGDPDPAQQVEGKIDELLNKFLDVMNKIAEAEKIEKENQKGNAGNVPTQTPQSAETSEGKVNAAGAVGLNIVTAVNEACIPAGIKVTAGGELTLEAKGNTDASSKADGSATQAGGDPTQVGVGAAVAINVAVAKTDAYIAAGATVEAGSLVLSAEMHELPPAGEGEDPDKENTFAAEAISGAGAGKVGVAGALAINTVVNEAKAHLDGTAELTGNPADDADSASISAESNSNSSAKAGSTTETDGATVGVGASFALNVTVNRVLAYLADNSGLLGAENLSLTVGSENNVTSEASAGAASASEIAVNGAVALTLAVNTVQAYLGLGETLNLNGDLTAEAGSSGKTEAFASGKAAGAQVGVGAALALNIAVDRTEVTTLRNLNIGGNVSFVARSALGANAKSEAGANGGKEEPAEGEGEGGDGEGDGESPTGLIDKQLNLLVTFLNQKCDEALTPKEKENVPQQAPANAQAETSEGKVNAAGAVSLNIAVVSAEAYIPAGITVTAGGELTLEALGNTDASSIADGSATDSGIGIGAAVALNVATVLIQAYLGENTVLNAGGLTVQVGMLEIPAVNEGEDSDTVNTFSAEAISGAGGANVGLAGSLAINVAVNEAKAHVDGKVNLTGDALIRAENSSQNIVQAGTAVKMGQEGQEAKVGVGASFASNVVINRVLAYLADYAEFTGDAGLSIAALLDSFVQTRATAGADPFTDILNQEPTSESKYALDAAVALSVVTNEVKAYSGTGSNIIAGGDTEISAESVSTTNTVSEGNSSGSKAAVGASVALNVIVATTEAALKGNADIGGALSIQAGTLNEDDVSAYATARGLNLERYINKFKRTAEQLLSGDFGLDQNGNENKKPQSAQALNNNGAKTAQTKDQNGGTTGQNSQQQQKISLAAAVGINVMTHNTLAYTGSGLVRVGGPVTVKAESHSNFATLGTGAAVSDGNGIAVGVALSNIFNKTEAYLGSTAAKEGTSSYDVTVRAVSSLNMSEGYRGLIGSEAVAGAASGKEGKIGAAGALAIIDSWAKTLAYIAPGAEVTGAGLITINAEDTSKLAVRAWAADGTVNGQAKAGVGATFAVIYANQQTLAYVGTDARVDAQGLNILAEKKRVNMTDFRWEFDFDDIDPDNIVFSDIFDVINLTNFLSSNNYYAEAVAGALSAGDMALAGAFAVLVFNNTTAAYIDEGAEVNTTGNISITARADINAKGIGGSVAAANKKGFGLTTINIVNADWISAYIGKGAEITAGGDISITSLAEQELTIIGVSGSAAGETGALGVFNLLFTMNTSEAFIGEGAEVKADGSILLKADNHTHAYLVAGGGTASSGNGVGGSLAVLIVWNNTFASIKPGAQVDSKQLIALTAEASELSISAVVSGTYGGKDGVAASGAIKTVRSDTRAYIAQGAKINQDETYLSDTQAISLSATDSTFLLGVSGTGSGGGRNGVGAAADITVLIKNVGAYIAHENEDDDYALSPVWARAAKNITLRAASQEKVVSLTAGFSGGSSGGVAGAAALVIATNSVRAYIGQGAVVFARGSVAIESSDDLLMVLLTGTGTGGGKDGVGGALEASLVRNEIEAYIGMNAKVTALGLGEAVLFADGSGSQSAGRGVLLNARSSENIVAFVVGGSGAGTTGVAGTAAGNIIITSTLAYIADGAKINIVDTIDLKPLDPLYTLEDAHSLQEIRLVSESNTLLVSKVGAGAGGGTSGVGGTVDLGIMVKQTKAYTGEAVELQAKHNILFAARSQENHISTTVGLSGGGTTGAAGSLSVGFIANVTEAYTGKEALLCSQGSINIWAFDNANMVLTAGIGAGAGSNGFGGSLAIAIFAGSTRAYLGEETRADARGLLEVKAESSENVVATALGATGGGTNGIAGSLAIKVISTTTQAYIGRNARVNQEDPPYGGSEQTVRVLAIDRVNSVGLSGTGGGTAGVAGALSIIAVGSLLDSHALSGLTGKNEEGQEVSTAEEVDGLLVNPFGAFLGDSQEAQRINTELNNALAAIGIGGYINENSEEALNNTQAFVGRNARVDACGDLIVKAEDQTVIIVAEAAGSGGGTAGVAGALAIVLLHDCAEAFIGEEAKTNAKGNTLIQAETSDNVFAAGVTGSGAGTAAVNGVTLVHVVRSDTLAHIDNEAEINQNPDYQTPGQSVDILANGNTYIVALAGSGGGAGAAAVGGAANIGLLAKNTKAYIDENAKVSAQKNIAIAAESSQLLVAVAISIFGAGTAAVSGDLGIFTFANNTEAYIGRDAFVDSEGNVKVSAADDSLLLSIVAVGNGSGAAAVAGALSVNTIVSQTKAYIVEGATVNARGKAAGIAVYTGEVGEPQDLAQGAWDKEREIKLDLNGDGIPDEVNVQGANKDFDADQDGNPEGSVAGDLNFNASSKDNNGENVAEKTIQIDGKGLGEKLTETIQGLAVVAVSNQKIITATFAVSGSGTAAGAGAVTINVLAAVTEASIGSGAVINNNADGQNNNASSQQTVLVKAATSALVVQTEGTVGGAGAVGMSGSFNLAFINNITEAIAGGLINAKQDILVLAYSREDLHILTANASGGGGAGVGGTFGVGVLNGRTLAYVLAGSNLQAGRDIHLLAVDTAVVNVDCFGGSGGGGLGAEGALAIAILLNNTKAYVEDGMDIINGACLSAGSALTVEANSSENVITLVGTGSGGGAVGVAGSIGIRIISTTTQAYIGKYAVVNRDAYTDENQIVTVSAFDQVISVGIAGTGTGGGGGGVGAVADITIIRNLVSAFSGDYSEVWAGGDIRITAGSDRYVNSLGGAGSGGGAVGVAGALSLIIINDLLDSDSHNALGGGNTADFVDERLSIDHVGGQLGGSEYTAATEEMVSGLLGNLQVSSYLNETSYDALKRTQAFIGVQAQVKAGGSLVVSAEDKAIIIQLAGSGTGSGAVAAAGWPKPLSLPALKPMPSSIPLSRQ